MAKLALKIEDLAVETFHTDPEAPARGTVIGAADTIVDMGCVTYQTACPDPTCRANTQCCSGYYSCNYTCNNTCGCTGGLRTRCTCPSGDYTDCCQTNEPC